MKNLKNVYVLFAATMVVSLLLIIQLSPKQDQSTRPVMNGNNVRSAGFAVHAASTDLITSAQGTIFVRGDEEVPSHVRIVAMIEIDSRDWGGVAFSIPREWEIATIDSSYPENKPEADPADYVATRSTASEDYERDKWIEVGRERYHSSGGGVGTIIIDLVPDPDADLAQALGEIAVEVGSAEKDGVKFLGTDYIKVPIP
ncbi:hypothetical protein FHS18_005789 [Paenibacillus phyllosphaerae]|uniref:Uncharacterized protein n=1 Tax=Paenibacillus phyllosphaerae TaxID=274593 RepID=A0A7W5B4S7_9BACL|nr:hypothetical protein [Paenibacillus phyllosphaerae]MBB3113676.1 hypothetical protein [Paenibacillus phyllosphaerae]